MESPLHAGLIRKGAGMKALPVEPSTAPVAIGSRIRAARQAQRLTIEHVADATGLTKGFLSRVERDLTSPSVASLVTLCQVLSVSVGDLFAVPETHLTRAADGPRISLGGDGIVERLLTARSERRLQIIHADIEPHGRGESELYAVDCEVDVLHVIAGELTLLMTNESFDLAAGDTLSFPGREPHSWINRTDRPVRALWILVPAATGN
ncbi:MAG: family transcriptional regulator [Micrococcaceae bacterium]|nr:family transcriptional regulator [Micrococcaceae bacterium]